MPQLTPTGAGVPPDITAVEEQLRRLGFGSSAMGMLSMQPPPPMEGTPDPQSAVASILAAQNAEFQKALAARQTAQVAPPPPPPAPVVEPTTNAAAVDGGKPSSGMNPLWALPAAVVAAGIARLMGAKGITRTAKGSKGAAHAAASTAKAAKAANAARKGVGVKTGTTPHNFPQAPTPHAAAATLAEEAPLELTDVVPEAPVTAPAALPPPTLTQTDLPPAISQALVERAKSNVRGPVSSRMPPEPTPRPVLPTYTAPLDAAEDFSGSELAKAIRISNQLERSRSKSAIKTEKLAKKRPPTGRPALTPDRRVPREEGERKAFNEVTKVIRETKNPPKAAPKNLRPWEQEPKPKGTGGQPVLPKKKPGPKPKPKYKAVPEVATALAKRKAPKRTPRSLSEAGKSRPTEVEHSGNKFGKFVGRSGAKTAANEPIVLRNLTDSEKNTVIARARDLLEKRNNPLTEKTGKTARAIAHREKGKYKLSEDFEKVYGNGPEARALHDAAVAMERSKRIAASSARKIKEGR